MEERKILDHGYLKSIDVWGSDERIVEAARMSTFLGWGGAPCPVCKESGRLSPRDGLYLNYEQMKAAVEAKCSCGGTGKTIGDEKLLHFLWENKHATPFEMAGVTIEVSAPIFVFREWHRHRVPFGYNEMSSRYTPLPDVNYIPSIERLMMGSDGKNKQAGTVGGAAVLTREEAENFRCHLDDIYIQAESLYQKALRAGVPKELARVHLPVGRYSRMRATGNLRGWLAFLSLRDHKAAQWEIRQYAAALHDLLREAFPRTLALFDETHKT